MENTENKLTKSVENPKAKNQLEHRTAENGNLNSHEASYKANDSRQKAGHATTPLKRQPILEQLVKTKRKKIGKERNYNNGEITENGLKKRKPCQLAQPLFNDDFKHAKPNKDAENGKDERKSCEDWKNSS